MAEVWLANVSVSLDESTNHRSNETLSAFYLPMGEDDQDTLHVDQWGGWIRLWAERSVGMALLL